MKKYTKIKYKNMTTRRESEEYRERKKYSLIPIILVGSEFVWTGKWNKYVNIREELMNYPQAKDLCVSRFIDFSNENASPYFCLESDFCPRNRLKYFNIFYFL